MKKKLFSLLLALCMVLTLLPVTAMAEIISSNVPKSINYEFDDSTGVMTLYGKGALGDGYAGSIFYEFRGFDVSQVETVIVSSGITRLGNNAFSNFRNMTSISIPDTVTEIGSGAFYRCSSLQSITLPENLTLLGAGAFRESAVRNLVIPAGVTTIYSTAFYDCYNLEKVTFLGPATSIGERAFMGCDKLTTVTFPGTAGPSGHVGQQAFSDCPMLRSIDLPEGVCSIRSNAFHDCSALEHLGLPSTVSWFEQDPFWNCNSLRSVTIPAAIDSFKGAPFWDCEKLEAIHFLGNAPSNYVHPASNPNVFYRPGTTGWEGEPWDTLPCYLWDPTVKRLAGSSRYDTAFLTADTLKEQLGVDKFSCAIVTSGENFADALAGSYLAYVKSAPILLTDNDNIADVMDYIRENVAAGSTVYALGGAAVVTDGLQAVENDGFVFKRLAGTSRFETNLEILKECGDIAGEDILVCTGYNFADSLSASAAKRPILLVDDTLNAEQKAYLAQQTDSIFYLVGGTGAVTTAVEHELLHYSYAKRLAGANRFATSQLVAETFFDSPTAAVLAYGFNFPDGLCAGPLAASMDAPLLLSAIGDEAAAAQYVTVNPMQDGFVLGGPTLISDGGANKIFGLD
ncbi:MAG: leucine-rich repeat protein [Oscillospiraceae bacterium]|nr:leucine-rich repeat protein [Oscillospiraceae bacterium]